MANEMLNLEFYSNIKEILETARKKAYAAINFAMVEAYWEIGKRLDETNSRKMREIYFCFQKRDALSFELTLLYNPV